MNNIDYRGGRIFNSLESQRNKVSDFRATWEDGESIATAIKNKVEAQKLIHSIITELKNQYPNADISLDEEGYIKMSL